MYPSTLKFDISVTYSMDNNNVTSEKIAGRGRFNHQSTTIKIEDENENLGNNFFTLAKSAAFDIRFLPT